jgi:hypothetical protein
MYPPHMLQYEKEIQILIEVTPFIVAFVAGLFTFKRLSPFYRLFFYQTIAYVAAYTMARVVTTYQASHNLPLNNQWVYNLYIFIETSMILGAAALYFSSKKMNTFLMVAFGIFLVTYMHQIITHSFWTWANYAFVVEEVLVAVICLLIVYSEFLETRSHYWSSPVLYIALGSIIFFAGNVPFMGMINYLQKSYPEINKDLFRLITNMLAIVRYIFYAIAFWMVYRKSALTMKKAV